MSKNKLALITLSLLAAGCTVVPGSSMSTRGKEIVYENGESAADTRLDKRVAVYPITFGLVERMKSPPPVAQPNPVVAQQKAAYRYRFGSGDVLNISVWAHNDLNTNNPNSSPQNHQVSRGAWVDEAGYVSYPLAGKILAKGKTISELERALTGRLKRYIKNPQVTINVTEFRSQKVSVTGAVKKPGQLPITNVPMTIMDAVNLAEGVSGGDTRNVKWTHNGIERTISLQNIMQHGDLSQNYLLSNGDIVYIPSGDNSKVYVMGETGKQATLNIGGHGLNLTQALGYVGGMNQNLADAKGVFVMRKAPEDAAKPIHVYQLNLKDATAYALGNQFQLQPEDVVFVTAAPVSRWNRVVSQLTNSFTGVSSVRTAIE